jgi:hypothetical protein
MYSTNNYANLQDFVIQLFTKSSKVEKALNLRALNAFDKNIKKFVVNYEIGYCKD